MISGFSGILKLDRDYRISVEVVEDGFSAEGDGVYLKVGRDLSGFLITDSGLVNVSLAEV
jgi:hypothetical protein